MSDNECERGGLIGDSPKHANAPALSIARHLATRRRKKTHSFALPTAHLSLRLFENFSARS